MKVEIQNMATLRILASANQFELSNVAWSLCEPGHAALTRGATCLGIWSWQRFKTWDEFTEFQGNQKVENELAAVIQLFLYLSGITIDYSVFFKHHGNLSVLNVHPNKHLAPWIQKDSRARKRFGQS
jgi:hypothetical protein